MKFGLFYEHQLPKPWDDDSEFNLLQQSLDQIEFADRLGYDYAWEVEHHFMEEYSHSSAPEVFLGAASQRTKQIRLGHGIVQLPTNHPARVAERVSTLDLLSNGRVELGLGEGSSVTELHPFGRRFRDKRAIWEESVRALIPMFTDEGTQFQGEYIDFPLRNVVPKPRQKPHPPLWVACSQLKTIREAGSWGMGALGFQFVDPASARAWVHAYYNAFTLRPNRLAAYRPNPNIAVVSALMCLDSDDRAREAAAGWTFFPFALQLYNKEGPFAPGDVNLWDRFQEWRRTDAATKLEGTGLVGSPATIRDRLRILEDAHIDQVILLFQAGKNRHEDIMESLELFAREVMPEFHGRDEVQKRWKEQVISGETRLEEIDTTPFDALSTQTPISEAVK